MKTTKMVLYTILILLAAVCVAGLVLMYWPTGQEIKNKGITLKEASEMRKHYTGSHDLLTTSDGETLFLRKWIPDNIELAKKEVAVLLFHGITAHSGAYDMAGIPLSEGGYTTFGLDYRGHGLSGGNRGDSPSKDRWIGDLAETVKYVKALGFSKVVVMGHSLGVAAAMCAADTIPNEIDGLILLSGAYESRTSDTPTPPMSFFKKSNIILNAIFRPSYRSIGYYRDNMTGSDDPLFNFRYTPRFLTMLDVSTLRLPADMNIPVLVGIGDKDELFEVDKVKDFYNLIPGDKKHFLVMENATHSEIPLESWKQIVEWLDTTW